MNNNLNSASETSTSSETLIAKMFENNRKRNNLEKTLIIGLVILLLIVLGSIIFIITRPQVAPQQNTNTISNPDNSTEQKSINAQPQITEKTFINAQISFVHQSDWTVKVIPVLNTEIPYLEIYKGTDILKILIVKHSSENQNRGALNLTQEVEFKTANDLVTIDSKLYYFSRRSFSKQLSENLNNREGLSGNASIFEILPEKSNGFTQYTVLIQPNSKFDYTFIKLSSNTKSEDLINTPRDIQSEMTDIIESIKW